MHYRSDPEYWKQWFPADFVTESFPGQFRNWFYSTAGDEHGSSPRGAVQDALRLRARLRRRRPPDAQELGQRHRVRRGGRAHGRRRDALDVRQRPARGQHPLRLAGRGRGSPAAAGAVERVLVLRHLRPAGRLAAGAGSAPRGAPSGGPLDRWILARAARLAGEVEVDLRTTTPWPPRGRSMASSRSSRPGTCAAPASASRGRADPSDRGRLSPPCTRRSWRSPGSWRRCCRSCPSPCIRTWSVSRRHRPPTAST